jgi:hypothetical protein
VCGWDRSVSESWWPLRDPINGLPDSQNPTEQNTTVFKQSLRRSKVRELFSVFGRMLQNCEEYWRQSSTLRSQVFR